MDIFGRTGDLVYSTTPPVKNYEEQSDGDEKYLVTPSIQPAAPTEEYNPSLLEANEEVKPLKKQPIGESEKNYMHSLHSLLYCG